MFDSILSFFLLGFLLGLAVASIICYKILTDRAKVQEESLKEKDRLLHDKELKYKRLLNDKDKEYQRLLNDKELKYKSLFNDKDKEYQKLLNEKERLRLDEIKAKNEEIKELKAEINYLRKDLARHNMQEAFVNVFGSEK